MPVGVGSWNCGTLHSRPVFTANKTAEVPRGGLAGLAGGGEGLFWHRGDLFGDGNGLAGETQPQTVIQNGTEAHAKGGHPPQYWYGGWTRPP